MKKLMPVIALINIMISIGTSSFTPTKGGGGGKSISHVEGEAQKVLG